MTRAAQLHAVVQSPWFEEHPPWLWPIADREPFTWIRLFGSMTQEDVGSVIAQLASYNQFDDDLTLPGLADCVLNTESLLLPGGLQVRQGDQAIDLGCCCGLGDWREWFQCLRSGDSPWMGHDPEPWVEWSGDVARVWSDGGFQGLRGKFAIEFTREELSVELLRVAEDLKGFLTQVATWATNMRWPHPTALRQKLDEELGISEPHTS